MNELLTSVSLRRLQVFATVCDTLHMARAAEQLGVAQPALSQQVQALERAIGVRLFHRRKRGIELSNAGQAFREEVTTLLTQHAGAIDRARRVARGEVGQLRVGYVGSAMIEWQFPAQLKDMHERYPKVEVTLRESSVGQMLAAIESGELDIALVRAPVQIAPPLQSRFHSCQELVVVLPSQHPLTELHQIEFTQLAPEPMIAYPDPDNIGIMRIASRLAEASGCKLNVKWRVSEIGSVLGMVAAGLGYGVVPRNIAMLAGPSITVRPLASGNPSTELWLVWHGQRVTPPLTHFLKMTGTEDR